MNLDGLVAAGFLWFFAVLVLWVGVAWIEGKPTDRVMGVSVLVPGATIFMMFAFPGILYPIVDFLVQLPGADEKLLRSLLIDWGGFVFVPAAIWLLGFLITLKLLEELYQESPGLHQFEPDSSGTWRARYNVMAQNQAAIWPVALPWMLVLAVASGLSAVLKGARERISLPTFTMAVLVLLITVLFLARALELVK